ncbi:MAG: glycine cleavage T C-terminal barrel domain-containing protein, partial [Alphaproteobacteria bacterium]
GKEALDAVAPAQQTRSLVTLIFEDPTANPLGHEPIYWEDKIIGTTTTAAFGYRIGRPVALAHIDDLSATAQVVQVQVTGKSYAAKVQLEPAFDPTGSRMRTPIHA